MVRVGSPSGVTPLAANVKREATIDSISSGDNDFPAGMAVAFANESAILSNRFSFSSATQSNAAAMMFFICSTGFPQDTSVGVAWIA